MEGLVTILFLILIVALAFIGFVLYYIFKQIEFIIRAINLYKKMVAREDAIIKILLDIRDNTKLARPEELKKFDRELDDSLAAQSLSKSSDDTVPYATDSEWICVCGAHNPLDRDKKIQNCSNCGKNRNYVLNELKTIATSSESKFQENENALGDTKDNDSFQKEDSSPILTDLTQLVNQENADENFARPLDKELSLSQTYFRLVFSGNIQSDKNIEEVKTKLSELYNHKYKMSEIDLLFFSGKPVVIKSNLNYQEAMRLQERLVNRIGGIFTIEKMEHQN